MRGTTRALLGAAACLLTAAPIAHAAGITATTVGGAPYAITTAGGELWFTDPSQNSVGHLVPGGPLATVTLPQRSSGPTDIAAGPDGSVWVAERGFLPAPAARVARITPGGSVSEFDIDGAPQALTAGPDGNIWVASGSHVVKVTPGGVPTSYPLADGVARDIAAGPDGALWYAGSQGANAGLGRITTGGALTFFPSPAGTKYSVANGPDGALWVAATGEIQRVSLSGQFEVFDTPGETPITSLSTGPDGNLWFTDKFGDQLGRITPLGTLTTLPLPIPATQPHAITSGPDGALWFTEPGTGRLGRVAVEAAPERRKPLLVLKVRKRPFGPRGAIRFSFRVPPVLPQPVPLEPDEDPSGAPDGDAYLALRIKHAGPAPRGCVRGREYRVGAKKPGTAVTLVARLPRQALKAGRHWCAGPFRARLRLEYFTSPGPGSGPDVLTRSPTVRGRIRRR